MKNINEINPADYGFYHLTPFTGNVDVLVYTSVGYTSAENFDLYQTDNGTLIAFTEKFSVSGYHDYRIASGSDSYIMQMLPYEDIQDVLEGTTSYPFSFYQFWNSGQIYSASSPKESWGGVGLYRDGQDFVRCDYDKYGPVPFYPRNTQYEFFGIRLVLSITGVGHLIRADVKSSDIPNMNTQIVNTYSKSLSGALKQISEWAEVTKPPFMSVESVAQKSLSFIDGLGLEDVMKDISNVENNMRVFRYLSGNSDIYEEIDENNVIPVSLKEYYLSHIRYKTLGSLLKNGSKIFSIDSSILDEEKKLLSNKIFEFILANGIDQSSNINEIENIVKTNHNLISTGANIQDIVNRYKFL